MRFAYFGGLVFLTVAFAHGDISSASGITTDAASESVYWECNGCTLIGVEGTAATHGSGTHLVYDLPGNHFYRNTCEPGAGVNVVCSAVEQHSGAHYLGFVNYRNMWLNNGSSETFHPALQLNLPSTAPRNSEHGPVDDDYINAFDTLTHSVSENAVLSALTSQLGTSVTAVDPKVDGVVYDYQNGTLTATVTFHDRSTRKYQLNKSSGGQFAPQAGTAIDSNHNTLPENHPPGYQAYTFFNFPDNYDHTNIVLLLAPTTLPQMVGGCAQEVWDGAALKCIHPF